MQGNFTCTLINETAMNCIEHIVSLSPATFEFWFNILSQLVDRVYFAIVFVIVITVLGKPLRDLTWGIYSTKRWIKFKKWFIKKTTGEELVELVKKSDKQK